jgi:hypothetical protein
VFASGVAVKLASTSQVPAARVTVPTTVERPVNEPPVLMAGVLAVTSCFLTVETTPEGPVAPLAPGEPVGPVEPVEPYPPALRRGLGAEPPVTVGNGR